MNRPRDGYQLSELKLAQGVSECEGETCHRLNCEHLCVGDSCSCHEKFRESETGLCVQKSPGSLIVVSDGILTEIERESLTVVGQFDLEDRYIKTGAVDPVNRQACFHRPTKRDVFCVRKSDAAKWEKVERENFEHALDLTLVRDFEINPFTQQIYYSLTQTGQIWVCQNDQIGDGLEVI